VSALYFGPMIGRQQIRKKQKWPCGAKGRQWCELSTDETSHIVKEEREQNNTTPSTFVSINLAER
jgi:hypothetical protein